MLSHSYLQAVRSVVALKPKRNSPSPHRCFQGAVIKAAPLPDPELIEGFGKRSEAGAVCERNGYKSALLITDQTLFGLGLHEKVAASLAEHDVGCTLFHDIDGEPTVRMVDAGRRAAMACCP